MELTLNDLQNDYVDLVSTVADGRKIDVRGLSTREVTNATLVFPDPTNVMLPIRTNRKINLRLAAVETLDIIAGTSHPELVMRAAPEYGDVLVDPSDLDYGAYGPRLATQLEVCVTALRLDPSSRQAVSTIWRPDDQAHVGDRPCTVMLQLLVRDDALELHTTMRSNDVWLGTPYDVFAFTQLQQTIAFALDLPVGQYVHHATSLHLYERNFDQAGQLDYAPDDVQRLCRDAQPRGVRPIDAAAHPVERHNFVLLRNTAFVLLESIDRGAEQPYADDAAWNNPWYAGQLEKLVMPKEKVE